MKSSETEVQQEGSPDMEDLRVNVRGLADPLQELIDALPANVRPHSREEHRAGSEDGIDFTDRWDSGPPWSDMNHK